MPAKGGTDMKSPLPDTWEGRRVLIIWTDAAFLRGSDWISFIVLKHFEGGFVLQGCDSPDGSKHDGDICIAKNGEIREMIEWVETDNDNQKTT